MSATNSTATPATTTTSGCPVPTKKGAACPHPVVRLGLCALHDPEATFAQQHEGYRAKLLRRPEVVAALARAATAPPTPLPPPVPSRASGLRGQGSARSLPRPVAGTVTRAGGELAAYVAEFEYAAARLAKVVNELPDPADTFAVARWRIGGQRALEAYAQAKAMRPATRL